MIDDQFMEHHSANVNYFKLVEVAQEPMVTAL